MSTLKELLEEKGYGIWSISPEATVYQGLELMAEKNIGALLVIKNNKLAGIFSERDYCRKVILKGKSSKDTLIGELMTSNILHSNTEDTLELAMTMMTKKGVRHMPVFENDELVGVITLGDVVKKMISAQRIEIDQFEKLFYGGYRA